MRQHMKFAAPSLAEAQAAAAQLDWQDGALQPMEGPRLFSIVIPCLNAAATLAQTLASVAGQALQDVEVIVVDGGSTDGTQDIIRAHRPLVTRWVSARDGGISDAFNRGIAASRGAAIKLINADDCLGAGYVAAARTVLAAHPEAGWIYGGVRMVAADGQVTRVLQGRPDALRSPIFTNVPAPHPSWTVRRDAYARVGLYSAQIRLAMDFEWMLRAARLGVAAHWDPLLSVDMGEGGASAKGANRRDRENFAIAAHYRSAPAWKNRAMLLAKLGFNSAEGWLAARGRPDLAAKMRLGLNHMLGRKPI